MNEEMWNFILGKLVKKAEMQTTPLRGVGFWFYAESSNGKILILSNGVKHEPKSEVLK